MSRTPRTLRPKAAVALIAAAIVVPSSAAAYAVPPDSPAQPASDESQHHNGNAPAQTQTVELSEGTNMAVAISPDHDEIISDLQGDLYSIPMAGGTATRVTKPARAAALPDWSPNGNLVAFQSYTHNNFHIMVMRPDGTAMRRVTTGKYDNREPQFSPDGTKIAFSSDRDGSYDIWVLDRTTNQITQWTDTPLEESQPYWSPDGTHIAFVVGEAKTGHIIKSVDAAGNEETLVEEPDDTTLNSPSWSPDGSTLSYTRLAEGKSKLVVGGQVVSGDEDVFPFPVHWLSNDELVYTADGHILRRDLAADTVVTIPFTATITMHHKPYQPKEHDFDSRRPHQAKGILSPVISPNAKKIAFTALNDLWLMRRGHRPHRLTHNKFTELQPTWSPNSRRIAYSSDRSGVERIYIRNVRTGRKHRLTASDAELASRNEFGASWCPDGSKVAFQSGIDGFASAYTYVADVKTGRVRQVLPELFEPGRPTWGPDCKTLAVAMVKTFSDRFRQGTNQIMTVDLDTGDTSWVDPVPFENISDRTSGDGPVWSPDGTQMAYVKGSVLWVLPVAPDGHPTGEPRRVTNEVADYISWTGDSKHIMYLSNAKLRIAATDGGRPETIPLKLRWKRDLPHGRTVIHAGALWDGTSSKLRHNVDIIVRGNRIVRVRPHRHPHNGPYVDASGLTVMPGLIEAHMHREWIPFLGSREGRELLAYGITSTMSMGDPIYRSRETREAIESGSVVGPRAFTNAEPINGSRTYYAFMRTTLNKKMLRREISRHRALDTDILKTYVRAPNHIQARAIKAAHRLGIGAYSHYFYPSMAFGQDGMTHLSATQRLGYSRTRSNGSESYADIIKLATASKMSITATPFSNTLLAEHPQVLSDPRIRVLYTDWQMKALRSAYEDATTTDQTVDRARLVKQETTLAKIMRGGGVVMAGTDEPLEHVAFSLHQTLREMVRFGGWTPYEALRAATSVPAKRLGVSDDLGTVERGKLADLSFVKGNPLDDIDAAVNVRKVMRGGHLHTVHQLLAPFKKRQAAPGGK
ncbi:MAG: amidohydrolase family protein [Nocardioidaceae bacterium]